MLLKNINHLLGFILYSRQSCHISHSSFLSIPSLTIGKIDKKCELQRILYSGGMLNFDDQFWTLQCVLLCPNFSRSPTTTMKLPNLFGSKNSRTLEQDFLSMWKKDFFDEEEVQSRTTPAQPFKLFHMMKTVPKSPKDYLIAQLELNREFGMEVSLDEWISTLIPHDDNWKLRFSREFTKKSKVMNEGTVKIRRSAIHAYENSLRKRENLDAAQNHDLIMHHWTNSLQCYRYLALVMIEDSIWMKRFGENISDIVNMYMEKELSSVNNENNWKQNEELFHKIIICLQTACILDARLRKKLLKAKTLQLLYNSKFQMDEAREVQCLCLQIIKSRKSLIIHPCIVALVDNLLADLVSEKMITEPLEGEILSLLEKMAKFDMLSVEALQSLVRYLQEQSRTADSNRKESVQYHLDQLHYTPTTDEQNVTDNEPIHFAS